MEFRKMVMMTLYARQQNRHRLLKGSFHVHHLMQTSFNHGIFQARVLEWGAVAFSANTVY